MNKFLLIVTAYCGLVTSVVAQIKTNPLPAPSLSMFQSSKNAPHEFEIQAAGIRGIMVFGQGKANISKNGTVSGEMNLTNFANNSSQSSARKSVQFSGKISNPRKVWEKTYTREEEIDQQADYLVMGVILNQEPAYGAQVERLDLHSIAPTDATLQQFSVLRSY